MTLGSSCTGGENGISDGRVWAACWSNRIYAQGRGAGGMGEGRWTPCLQQRLNRPLPLESSES